MVSIILNFVNIYGVHYITYVIENSSEETFLIYFDEIEVIVEPGMRQTGKVFEHINPELYDVLEQQLIQEYKDDKETKLIINRFDKLTTKYGYFTR